MCLMDDADGCVDTIESGNYYTARKAHKCAECYRQIDAGERYHREVYVFEHRFTVHKTCAHCMVVREWLWGECGGWIYGAVEEDAREHCDGQGYGMDLYRAVVGMRHSWRRKNGTLLPIPGPISTADAMLRARETQR